MSARFGFFSAVGNLHRRYFAQRPVRPGELPRIMRKHIYTGAMGSVWGNLIVGLFFVYFAEVIGLKYFHWGWLNGIALFLITGQLLSAWLTQRWGRRKMLWFYAAVAERVLRFLAILLGFVLWQAGYGSAALVFIALTCLAVFFGAIATPPWYAWLGDIIPEKTHGGFWGRRSAWQSLAVVGVTIPAAILMDRLPHLADRFRTLFAKMRISAGWINGGTPDDWKVHIALAMFVIGTVVGMIDLVIHGTIPEPAPARTKHSNFRAHLLAPLRDRRFRPWLIFNQCWTFSVMVGASLATPFFMKDLGLKQHFFLSMISLTVVVLLGNVLTASWSGRLVDRVGIKPVLFWGQLAWSVLPVLWIFCRPDQPYVALLILGFSSFMGGTSSTAAATAANKLVTRFSHPSQRAMYVAVDACLASLAGGVGSIVAGLFQKHVQAGATAIQAAVANVFHVPVIAEHAVFHILFVVSFGLRLASSLVLIRFVRTPDEAAVRAAADEKGVPMPVPAMTASPVPASGLRPAYVEEPAPGLAASASSAPGQ